MLCIINNSICIIFQCSIWPIDSTLSGATTLGLSGPGSNGNKEILSIPQSSIITGSSPSNGLVSYLGHSFWVGGLTPLERCSQHILQLQLIGLVKNQKVNFSISFNKSQLSTNQWIVTNLFSITYYALNGFAKQIVEKNTVSCFKKINLTFLKVGFLSFLHWLSPCPPNARWNFEINKKFKFSHFTLMQWNELK